MAVLQVNQSNVPTPSEMAVSIFDVSSTTDRNARGDVVVDRVAVKRRLELKWAHLSPAELRTLLAAIGENAFFEVSYPDPATGAARTMTCYADERTMAVLRMDRGAPVWRDLKMSWIER